MLTDAALRIQPQTARRSAGPGMAGAGRGAIVVTRTFEAGASMMAEPPDPGRGRGAVHATLADIVHELRSIRTHLGAPHAAARRRLLREASTAAIDDVGVLLAYHELLLFAAAFPDDRRTLDLADSELRRLARATRNFMRRARQRDVARLRDSGIAHSETLCRLSVTSSNWLAARFPRDTEIAWHEGSGGDGLDAMLATVVEPAESDGLAETVHSTQEWVAVARGAATAGSDLRWLLDHFAALRLPTRVHDHVFDLFELEIRWRLDQRIASRSFARLPHGRRHYHSRALSRSVDLATILATPLPHCRPQPKAQAGLLIDTARAVLAVRHRETDPVTFAEPRDVTFFDLGHGIGVALFGHQPAQRGLLNTYYGFVLAKNRVPVAYGGGWMFFDRCEIGINVFDTFRGGESAHTFAQLLRLYHHHFKVRVFTVEPYQFGAGNPEAIRSAAFWFYYRFGFRPIDTRLRTVAERAWQRLHGAQAERTSPATLRRLCGSYLELDLAPHRQRTRLEPGAVSLAATHWIGARFGGDREAARSWSITYVERLLDSGDRSRWPEPEQRSFADLAVLIAPLSGLADWSATEKRDLLALMRAKGGVRERRFALGLARHRRLRAAWETFAQTAERAGSAADPSLRSAAASA